MRLASNVAIVALGLTLAGSTASATLVGFKAQLDAGGSTGTGTANFDTDKDFFKIMQGGAFGAKVEVDLLGFLAGFVEHQQFVGSGGFKGSWTQIMAGSAFDFGLSADNTVRGGVGMAIGFGIGTLQPVKPPLDAGQVEKHGFVGQVNLNLDKELSKSFRVGITVPIGYHYLFQGSKAANDPTSQSQGIHVMGLLTLTFVHNF